MTLNGPGQMLGCLLIQPGDLGALDAEARHQALLVEDEGIDVLLQGGGRQRLRLGLATSMTPAENCRNALKEFF